MIEKSLNSFQFGSKKIRKIFFLTMLLQLLSRDIGWTVNKWNGVTIISKYVKFQDDQALASVQKQVLITHTYLKNPKPPVIP